MADREKVIKGLEYHMECDFACGNDDGYCPYIKNANCVNKLLSDAIELLKEQEPIKPEISEPHDEFGSWWFRCGACDYPIDPDDKYCRHCGRSVK